MKENKCWRRTSRPTISTFRYAVQSVPMKRLNRVNSIASEKPDNVVKTLEPPIVETHSVTRKFGNLLEVNDLSLNNDETTANE